MNIRVRDLPPQYREQVPVLATGAKDPYSRVGTVRVLHAFTCLAIGARVQVDDGLGFVHPMVGAVQRVLPLSHGFAVVVALEDARIPAEHLRIEAGPARVKKRTPMRPNPFDVTGDTP